MDTENQKDPMRPTVTVSVEDLRVVLQAADYMTDRSLRGPVDRLSDAVVLATRAAAAPDALRERVEDELDAIWRESQGDRTIIRDAGIMQDIVHRLRAAIASARTEAACAAAPDALRERVEALTYASDDGTEYEHNGHAPHEGEPECPGCWAASIRAVLAEQ